MDTQGRFLCVITTIRYAYDSTGNQTGVKYPDGTTTVKEYDLVGNLTKVTEADGRAPC